MKGVVSKVFTNCNSKGLGDKVIIEFGDLKCLLVDKYWGRVCLLKDTIDMIELAEFRNSQIENILVIEGVATYISFKDGRLIHLFEEMEDLERLASYYRIEIVDEKKDESYYNELQQDIKDAEVLSIDI